MKNTLYLISCSDHKQSGGVPYPSNVETASMLLSGDLQERLHATRQQVLQLITDNQVLDQEKRQGYRGRDPRNSHLVLGRDFGKDSHEGRYLPACQRYTGRFFGQIQNALEERSLSLGL